MSYRFDKRTQEDFKKDIKKGHAIEAEIAVRICIALHAESGDWPELTPNGVDSTGKFIEEDSNISNDPDFDIDGTLVEITRSDTICKKHFHQKTNKINRFLKDQTTLVFVNGYSAEKNPKYIWLCPSEIEQFTIKAKTKYGEVFHPGAGKTGLIGKSAYRYDLFWFEDLWKPLPALIKNIPENYLQIINKSKV